MSPTTRIALLQHPCLADVSANIQMAIDMIRDAANQGAKVILTQELFASLYFCQTEDPEKFDLAIPIPSTLTNTFCELANELGIHLILSLFEKRVPGLFHNTSICIDSTGKIINRYRKMHIPDDPGFYEKFYFTPGDLGYQTTQLGELNIGTLICWDQWFPEAARLTAMQGAQILTYPTAIGYWEGEPKEPDAEKARQKEAWQTIQRSHAIANGCFVAAINRVGSEGEIKFWGSSFVADPGGNIIAQASEDQPEILICDIDISLMDRTRQMWPFFRDRRIDSYDEMTNRFSD